MLHIRTLTDVDLTTADAIFCAAFHTQGSRIQSLRQNLLLQPDGWFLALQAEQPVGLIGCINYGPFAYVGSLAVLPALQRQGIGQRLLEHLLLWLEQQGCTTALLDATPEGARLYERHAFVDDDSALHWSYPHTLAQSAVNEVLPDTLCHSDEQQHVEILQQEDIADLTAFDAQYFGAGRAAVFSLLRMQYPDRSLVLRDAEGWIRGYLFVQQGILGPWVAENTEDARLLLAHALRLRLPFDGHPAVFTPGSNHQSCALLESTGFIRMRVLRHMRRGAPFSLRQPEHLYGLASFTLG